jgi:hypothetical protein
VTSAADGRVDASRVRNGLASAGLDLAVEDLEGLVEETVEHAIRVQAEQRARTQLAEVDLPTLELPDSTDGVDTAALYEFAELLVDQGVR